MREHIIRLVLTVFFIYLATTDLNSAFESFVRLSGKLSNYRHHRAIENSAASSQITSSSSFTGSSPIPPPPVPPSPTAIGSTKRPSSDDSNHELVLSNLKQQWLSVMQEHCLPKLVCELHAASASSSGMTDVEIGLLNIIKETTLLTSSTSSKYHFAAHMGLLLQNVDGNGCHNIYTNCPLSRINVLEMVKRVKIK